MSANVVLVHSSPAFLTAMSHLLWRMDCRVTSFVNSIAAWPHLRTCDGLAAELSLPPGQPSGFALSRGGHCASELPLEVVLLAKSRAEADSAMYLGDTVLLDASPHEVAMTVRRLLAWRAIVPGQQDQRNSHGFRLFLD